MRGLARIPQLETAQIKTAWGGLYDVTPDHHAILGAVEEYPRFFQANGFSGHGFMHAPAVGQVISELIMGKPPVIDISPLFLSRFAVAPLSAENTVI